MTSRILTVLFVSLGMLRAQVSAEGIRPPTAEEILVLHQAGLPAAELQSVLDKNGVPALGTSEIKRLAEAGVPETTLSRLRAGAKTAPRKVSVEDVIKMAASGVPEDAILETIRTAESPIQVSADEWLDLVRKGISPNVLKALRGKVANAKAAESRSTPIALDDLPRLHAEGVTAAEIVQRIRAADASFDVSVDQVMQLSRQGISKDVLKEVWARRSATAPQAETADSPTPIGAASRPSVPGVALALHVESGGNFSLLVPNSFRTHRESRGANALVSFLLGDNDKTTGLAEAELSVFRYRSSTPDRLNEANLTPIANNFLGSLQASYAKRQLTVSFGERQPSKAAGQPALHAKVVISAADGTTHQGEIMITWADDQIFVVSTAVRTDRIATHGTILAKGIHSFGLLTRKTRPTSGATDDEKLAALAAAWRDAVVSRDWSLYDSLFVNAGTPEVRRERFVALCDRFDSPGRKLVLGPASAGSDRAKVQYRVIPSDPPESFEVAWIRDGQSFALGDD